MGLLYGSRSDHGIQDDTLRCDGLVDINWKDYDWDKHLAVVEKHSPMLGAVPDITSLDLVDDTLVKVRDLDGLCEFAMVIPKVHRVISYLPSNVVIGVSVPSKYAGFLPMVNELRGRRVHLLGGSPNAQAKLGSIYKRSGVDVLSVDGNGVCYPAGLKKFWCFHRAKWVKRPDLNYYELIKFSLQGWIATWYQVWGEKHGVQRVVGSGPKGFFDSD